MKPVIITLNSDNKVVMSVEEFKHHMDAAYNQGHSDGTMASATITYPSNANKWWYDVTCNGSVLNTNTTALECKITPNHIALADNVTSDTCDCVSGHCNCDVECANQSSISSYIRNKGE